MSARYVLARTRFGERAHAVRARPSDVPPDFGVSMCRLFDGPWYTADDDLPLCKVCVARAFGNVAGPTLLTALENPGLTLLAATAEREP